MYIHVKRKVYSWCPVCVCDIQSTKQRAKLKLLDHACLVAMAAQPILVERNKYVQKLMYVHLQFAYASQGNSNIGTITNDMC
jgi:hypothetical protein